MYIVKSATNLEVSKHDQSRASIEFHMILGNFAQDSHTYNYFQGLHTLISNVSDFILNVI